MNNKNPVFILPDNYRGGKKMMSTWNDINEWWYDHPGQRSQLEWVHWAQDSLAIMGEAFIKYLKTASPSDIWGRAFLDATRQQSGGDELILIPPTSAVFERAKKLRARYIAKHGFDTESVFSYKIREEQNKTAPNRIAD